MVKSEAPTGIRTGFPVWFPWMEHRIICGSQLAPTCIAMKKTAVIYWSGTGNTEAMANAVASSSAYRVLIPMNLCSTYVAGVDKKSSAILDDAMAHIRLLLEGMENKP